MNAGLDGLRFNPPAGFHGTVILNIAAHSFGAAPLEASLTITNSIFTVTTFADAGPGSLRQAILDSNAVGGRNTIDFEIPGIGLQTIALDTPLPPVTTSTVLDGSTQPGFTGVPLVLVTNRFGESSASLEIENASVTVRGVRLIGFAGGNVDSYQINSNTSGLLVARVHAEGVSTRLLLRDAQGQLLEQSDGESAGNLDDVIDLHVPAGSYILQVESLSGEGSYTLMPAFTPGTSPFQPSTFPYNVTPIAILNGDFNEDGHLDLAVGTYLGA